MEEGKYAGKWNATNCIVGEAAKGERLCRLDWESCYASLPKMANRPHFMVGSTAFIACLGTVTGRTGGAKTASLTASGGGQGAVSSLCHEAAGKRSITIDNAERRLRRARDAGKKCEPWTLWMASGSAK